MKKSQYKQWILIAFVIFFSQNLLFAQLSELEYKSIINKHYPDTALSTQVGELKINRKGGWKVYTTIKNMERSLEIAEVQRGETLEGLLFLVVNETAGDTLMVLLPEENQSAVYNISRNDFFNKTRSWGYEAQVNFWNLLKLYQMAYQID